MAEWTDAPAVELLARQLIGKYHGHLAGARIKYIFREGKWSSQDKTTWAKAYKVSERDNFLTGYDFYVVVNKEVWNELDSSETREAMIDHELSHCGQTENGSWCIWGHDVEDFSAIVRRHGLWNESVRKYLRAAENREKEGPEKDQVELFEEFEETELGSEADSESEPENDECRAILAELAKSDDDGQSNNIDWILNCSVGDVNYDSAISRLTNDELLYCLRHEERKSGFRKLKAEARKRGIQLPDKEGAA